MLGLGLLPVDGAAFSFSPSRGCYLVGQPVALRGIGFAPSVPYAVSIDGVYFGLSRTNAAGAFASTLRPGGFGAGEVQAVDRIQATDGTSTERTSFTLTRAPGGRILASGGDPRTVRAPLEVWGFARDGRPRTVYLHYLTPAGHPRATYALGETGGQCGFLRTSRHRVFPFPPSVGDWTFQFDTRPRFSPHPRGPVARIHVLLARG